MPYWSVYCLYCGGFIVDALLECVPASKQSTQAFKLLFSASPGACLACAYCNGMLAFDGHGQPQPPQSGWPVLRYGRRELELKKQADGEPPQTSLTDWALRHRFVQPGLNLPFTDYVYAEQAAPDETVP